MRKRWMLLAALFLPCVAHADRIIVKMAEPSGYAAAIASVNAAKVLDLELVGAEVWEVADSAAAIAELSANPNVEYAEPDYPLTLKVIPNDPCFSPQWWANNTPANTTGCVEDEDVDAVEAWDIWTGSPIVVAVIDTGTDHGNLDLTLNQWTNPGDPLDGFDNDFNGKFDDWRGWDFGNNDKDMTDHWPHGTRVGGILGARGNNSFGHTGATWNVQMMNLKIWADNGTGTNSMAIAALGYAVTKGAKIANLSWGTDCNSTAMRNAFINASNAGLLMVTAAGNDALDMSCGNSSCCDWPTTLRLPNVISVGASNCDRTVASFSNYGAQDVHLFAPGAWMVGPPEPGTYCTGNGIHGTSFAAPVVAGAAALVWSKNPSLTAGQVKAILLNSTDNFSVFAGKCITGGRLNICKALGGCWGNGGGGSGCENPPCEIENESIVPPPDETMALTLSLAEARERADLYDVTGRKVRAQRPGIYFQRVERAGVVTRRTVVVR